MNINSRSYLYTKCVFKYIIKNNFFIGLLYVIDYVAILAFLTNVPKKLLNLNKFYDDEELLIFYISPYNYYKKYIKTDNVTYMISVIVIVVVLMIAFYFILLFLNKNLVNSKDSKQLTFKRIYVNFYEIILFRFLTIYILDSYITAIIKCVYKSYEGDGFIYSILLFFLMIVLFYLVYDNINHFATHAVIANLKAYPETLGNFPFDLNFSNNYDMVTLIVKIFIVLDKNLYPKFDKIVNYRIFFLNVIPMIIVIIYFSYIIILFYVSTHELLYFPLKKTSIIRNSLIAISCASMLYNGLTLFFILFYFLSHDETTVLNTFYRSTNYIGMLIFLISNDLDYNQIIAKWIISHKVICTIQDCPICTNIVDTFGKIIPSKVNIQKFFTFVVDVIDKEIAKGNLKLTPEEKIYLDIIRLYNMQFRRNSKR